MDEARIGIIGGGLVGLSLGLALASVPRTIIDIFEAKTPPSSSLKPHHEGYTSQYDARSLALASGSVEVLKRMGVWEKIFPFVAPIKDIQVSRQGSWGQTHISASEESVDALGYVLEMPRLALLMLAEVQKKPAINLHWDTKIDCLLPKKNTYQVAWSKQNSAQEASSAREANFDLLIIADGEHSSSCAHLGIRQVKTDYGQSAMVGNIDVSEPLKGKAIERFTDSGVLAILPLNTEKEKYSQRAAVVWAMSALEAQAKYAVSADAFKAKLQAVLGRRLGVRSVGHLNFYPLSAKHAEEIIRPQLLVMGNAAHALHPVAAQGFNLSMRDISFILDMVNYAQNNQLAVGNYSLLVQYQQQRQADQQRVSWFIDGLVKSYVGSGGMTSGLQSLGLFLFDILPGSKGSLARFAMGARQVKKYQFSY